MASSGLKTRLMKLESVKKHDASSFRDRFIVAFDNGNGILYDSVTRTAIPQERLDKARTIIHVSKDCRRD